MNPEYVAAQIVHTIPEKLTEYFLTSLANFFVIFILIVMVVNAYMLRRLRRTKERDYIVLLNVITLGIYSVISVITAVLVSRFEPHGTLAVDNCDFMYMLVARGFFCIAAVINIICFVINIFAKIKKDNGYKEIMKRGYYAEENENRIQKEASRNKSAPNKSIIDSISSFSEIIMEKVDLDNIKEKVNHVTEDVQELINKRNGRN